MVQRVPAHLGETEPSTVSPWLMVAGIALLLLVVCAVLFVLFGGGTALGLGGTSSTPTATRTLRTQTPAITILPVTLVPPSPTPTVPTTRYRVKAGDSLLEIAARYKVSVQAIKTANNLKDDTIRVGDELIIPLPTPTPQPGAPPSTGGTPTPLSFQSPPNVASPAATSGVIPHIVKRGETLIYIATLYNSTVDAIRLANKLDSDLLSIGQELQVPVGAWTPTATPASLANTPATPTAQFVYAAPSLMSPSDGAAFRGKADAPMLAWTSPATLESNEYYLVHLDYIWNGEKKTLVKPVRQGNSIRLDPGDYPGANTNGTPFSWYVVIVSPMPPKLPGQPTQTLTSSPASPVWKFVWY
jgi:LysM repeat protein